MTDINNKYQTVKEWAYAYRNIGWNVIPLFDTGKNPASAVSVLPNGGWLDLQKRMSTDAEFERMFADPRVTGLGVITGKISNLVVVDEDSYAMGGKPFLLDSPWVSRTTSNGRHIFFSLTEDIAQVGLHRDFHIEVKAEGGFIVLPPTKAYKKDASSHYTLDVGTYRWEKAEGNVKNLPTITEKDLLPYKPSGSVATKLGDNLNVKHGNQHNSFRTVCDSLFAKYPEEQWDQAEQLARAAASTYEDYPQSRIDRMIIDSKKFVHANPPTHARLVVKTDHNTYSSMTEQELKTIEKRHILHTGLSVLDRCFSFPTGFYIICANPGAGKGWFATWLIKQFFLTEKKQSVFFSLEMSEPLVRQRILQQWSDLTEDQLEKGDTSMAILLMQQDAAIIYPFGQADPNYQTPANFEKDIKDFYAQGYRLFFFDHFHELSGANVNDKNQSVSEVWGKVFRKICDTYPDIWLFVFAQPNGAAANKRTIKRTDIAGSKAITQRCDFFLSLNRQMNDDPKSGEATVSQQNREIYLWVDKNRISSQQYVGATFYLSSTGNFTSSQDADVRTATEIQEIYERQEIEFLDDDTIKEDDY